MRDKPDYYTQKAKKEGYPARSVYKLKEIQYKFKILKPGSRVLDIGASPGSWSIFALNTVKNNGFVTGIDLSPLELKKKYSNYLFIKGDIFKEDTCKKISEKGKYNVILSDAAPSTTGNRTVDTQKSYNLAEQILNLSKGLLLEQGCIVIKIFQGGDEIQLLNKMKGMFKTVKTFKPKACRKNSFEIYFIGLNINDRADIV